MRYLCLVVILFTGFAGEVSAHAITALSVVSDFEADGDYRLELGIDVKLVRDAEDESGVAVADPDAPLSEEEIAAVVDQVEEYIATSLRFYFDEGRVEPVFEIVEVPGADLEGVSGGPGDGGVEMPPMKRYSATAKGVAPEKAGEFLLEATPEAVAPVIFIIFRDGKPTRHSQVLYSGEFSRPVDLEAIRKGEVLPRGGRKPQVEVEEEKVDEEAKVDGEKVEEFEVEVVQEEVGGAMRAFRMGLGEGARQFVPAGLVHSLFVVAFLLLSWRPGAVFGQVVAFVLAHSITLALGALEWLVPSAEVVEAAVAISVGCVALDNLIHREAGGWRVALVFVLGLAHGLSFAEAFALEGLTEASFLPGLIGFNLGIEVGLLSLILVAAVLLSWMRGWSKYRACVVVPGSIVLVGVAIFLTVSGLRP